MLAALVLAHPLDLLTADLFLSAAQGLALVVLAELDLVLVDLALVALDPAALYREQAELSVSAPADQLW